MVILIFIFLTPKSWFTTGERAPAMVHPSPVARTLVLTPEVVGNEEDRSRIEQRVKELLRRTDVEVLDIRKVSGPDGKTRSFEVDIR